MAASRRSWATATSPSLYRCTAEAQNSRMLSGRQRASSRLGILGFPPKRGKVLTTFSQNSSPGPAGPPSILRRQDQPLQEPPLVPVLLPHPRPLRLVVALRRRQARVDGLDRREP